MIFRTKRTYIFIFLFILIFIYIRYSWIQNQTCECGKSSYKEGNNFKTQPQSKIKCLFEGTRWLQCFRDENDIYLPFEKFIRKQFEATGRVVKDGLDQRFEYFTSYAKIRLPDFITYDPFSFFGHFGSYNVEIRERVRCISAEFGVPMSTQWDSIPYFYPIQIAQFALQHYSRNLTDKPPKVKSIQLDQLIEQEHAVKKDESSVKITSSENGVIIALDDDPSFTVLIFSWIPENDDAAFSVTITDQRSHRTVKLMYKFVEDRRCVWPNIETDDYNEDNRKQDELVFTYSLGKRDHFSFQTIVRDILIDTSKALALVEPVSVRKDGTQNGGLKTGDITLLSLKFYGDCTIRAPIKQQTKAHHEMFLRASEWFLKNQDSQGGWAVPVQRTIADNQLVLAAGWHSAMAQGHALSVLTRAFHATQDSSFIEAGEKALHLFNKPASEGGVKNSLFGYDFFEEYPTVPGTFVLNGFLYSLIGLYDFSAVSPNRNETMQLFNTGLKSLNEFLPLYDTGSGSIYDLRHLSLKSAPNLARWDYHAVHVYLLKWLYIITQDKELDKVVERWAGYAHGKKAKHN